MIVITEQPPNKNVIPELTQIVLEGVVIKNTNDMDFRFMDGTIRKVTLQSSRDFANREKFWSAFALFKTIIIIV